MVCSLIGVILVVLLMFNVYGIIGSSKLVFFNFSSTGRVKESFLKKIIK